MEAFEVNMNSTRGSRGVEQRERDSILLLWVEVPRKGGASFGVSVSSLG